VGQKGALPDTLADVATCPACSSEDLELVEQLTGDERILGCLACGHRWQRGEPARPRRTVAVTSSPVSRTSGRSATGGATFASVWSELQARLGVRVGIPNWTRDSGFRGEGFTVIEVSQSLVRVDPPGARALVAVPRGEFEKVFAVWGQYRSNGLPRQDLVARTRFSKYIISIFHWLEGQTGAQLV
jgi:Zn ribbon nucleic-acid-binding protein